MAFEGLSDKLDSAFKKLRSKGSLNESDVKEAMREVRLALLEADVSYKVAKDFTARVTEKAIGAKKSIDMLILFYNSAKHDGFLLLLAH